MHLFIDNTDDEFVARLLNVGNGLLGNDSHDQNKLPFPPIHTEEDMIATVIPYVYTQHFDNKCLCYQAFIVPKNVSVTEMNISVLNILPGEKRSNTSFDNISSRDHIINYPVEILNKGTTPQFPLLKIGSPIMLFRQLDSPKRCNGTIFTMKCMISHVREAAIMSRKYGGVKCFIFRITMGPNVLLFEYEKLHFPVRFSFAMTINISQGQSMKTL